MYTQYSKKLYKIEKILYSHVKMTMRTCAMLEQYRAVFKKVSSTFSYLLWHQYSKKTVFKSKKQEQQLL